jgi:anti-sigma B factor antagonist
MEITHRYEGQVASVSVVGSLDALTAPDLNEFFNRRLAEGNSKFVVDLSRLEYTSSAGLRVLLSAVKEARAHGGDLRLAAAQTNVKKVFELSGFVSIMLFFPDVATAVASF